MTFIQNRSAFSYRKRRALVFLFHVVGVAFCYYFAYLLRFDFNIPARHLTNLWKTIPIAILVYMAIIIIFRLYVGIWSYFSVKDCLRHICALALAGLILGFSIFVALDFSFRNYPRSALLIHLLLFIAWEVGSRMLVRIIKEKKQVPKAKPKTAQNVGKKAIKNSLILGSLDESDQLLRSISRNNIDIGKLVGVICEDKNKRGSTIHRTKVLGELADLAQVVRANNVNSAIILPPFASPKNLRLVIDEFSRLNVACDFRTIPSYSDIASGEIESSMLKKVEIEDLLQRKSERFDRKPIDKFIKNQNILVTGGGGSIGSEICRQVCRHEPNCLVILDHSEYALFTIENELRENFPKQSIIAIAGDVTREDDIEYAFAKAGAVSLVYHAAAYKHVGLMEDNIFACYRNNVIGSFLTAKVAQKHHCQRFILVSTDKAVRPKSLMGTSKRLAEIFTLSQQKNTTIFKAVRFGNVLGSSGSVVPIFKKQIKRGGPVTVSSPKAMRYFMTIPEAVELVIMASVVGGDREIMILEMGLPVKIETLARKLIELSGLVPDKDIEIVYTKLKKGEKETEELITNDENISRTDIERIYVLKKNAQISTARTYLAKIETAIADRDADALREISQNLIPDMSKS